MAGIKDVAELAGVSISTVSRILNGDTRVRPETLRKVQGAASDLGYTPSPLGRGLRRQSLAVWALIIGDVENPLFTGATRGVEDIARAAGYSVLLCNSDESPAKESEYLNIATQLRVAGVVITPTSAEVDVSALLHAGIPVVAMDRPVGLRNTSIDAVLVDTRTAAHRAVDELVARGATRIACITGDPHIFTTSERVLGYREALQQAGLPFDDRLIAHTNLKIDGGREAAERLLCEHDVDGLLITNSLMTVGAVAAVSATSRTIGSDLFIAAFDDAPWTTLLNPEIVTISQPAYSLGEESARLLLERLGRTTRSPRSILLQATVNVRRSAPLPLPKAAGYQSTTPVRR